MDNWTDMNVVCIDNNINPNPARPNLTNGKPYKCIGEASHSGGFYIIIIDDSGKSQSYFKNRFKLLSDVREEKINLLLDAK